MLKLIAGLKLDWQLLGAANVANHDSKSKSVWKVRKLYNSYTKDLNVMTIMNLVHKSKACRRKEKVVWRTLLKHRWNIDILKTSFCLDENQVAEVIYKIGQDLNLKYD